MKKGTLLNVISVIIWVITLTGEVKCVIKAVECNWKPIGKAEIIYTASALSGAGIIVGWLNIEDD